MKMALKLDEKKKISKVKDDFLSFAKHMWPEFIEGRHHKIIGDKFNQIAQGKIKRIHGVTARFLNTVGAEIGPTVSSLDRVPFRDSSMAMNQAVPMFSGDKEVSFPSGYDNDAQIVIQQTQPLPMTVLAIMRRSNTFDA